MVVPKYSKILAQTANVWLSSCAGTLRAVIYARILNPHVNTNENVKLGLIELSQAQRHRALYLRSKLIAASTVTSSLELKLTTNGSSDSFV